MLAPINHPKVKVGERMANIHDEKNALQGFPSAEKALDHGAPGLLDGFRNFGIAIAWKVDNPSGAIQVEEVKQLRATGRLTDPSQIPLLGQCIDGTGLSRIRPACKGHFGTLIGWGIFDPWGAGQKLGLMVKGIQHKGPRKLAPVPGF